MAFPFPTYVVDSETSFERGVQHGTLARDQVAVSIETYRSLFRDFVNVDWAEAKAIGERYAPSIEAFDREYLEEIRGVAAGSGFETAEILALNARSEIGLSARMLDGCTALAAFGTATTDGSTILAQNWDWRASQRDAFVVLQVRRPGKPEITMLTEAGIIGKFGFNSHGLGVCLNALFLDQVHEQGTPLHVVLRGILESRNLGEAIETIARARIASGANFVMAQNGVGAIDVEALPEGLGILLPERDAICHTNHLLSTKFSSVREFAPEVIGDTFPRLGRIRHLIDVHHGAIDAEAVQSMLRDHANGPDGICRHEDHVGDPEDKRLQSVFSVVMELSRREMSVTDGPPCGSEFFAYECALGRLGAHD